jgi:HEAT repeat protein
VAGLLREVLETDTPAGRAAAARALGRLDASESSPLLAIALADADLWVRYYAARSAAASGAAALDAALAERGLHDPAVPVRIAALQALMEVGGPLALLTLAALVDDPEPEIRLAMLEALGGSGHPDAVHALGAAVAAGDAETRRAVLLSLGGEAAAALAPELAALARAERDAEVARGAVFALLRAGTVDAARRLCRLAAEPALRGACVEALARLPVDRLDVLAGELHAGGEAVAEAILAAVAHMRGPAAERLAAGALDHPSPAVRRAAEQALSRLDLRAAVDGARHA